MYCTNCGKELNPNADICLNCGAYVKKANTNIVDSNSTGLNILSFLWPLVGLILYLCYKDKAPIRAKGCGKWALIGFCISFAIFIISFIFSFMAYSAY